MQQAEFSLYSQRGKGFNPCECFPHRPATNLPHVMVSASFNQSSTKNGVDAIL